MSTRLLVGRRAFLTAVPAGAAAVPLQEQTGSRPSRSPTSYPGAQLYDEKERVEVNDALESRSLFRWYGPGSPTKNHL